MALNFLAVDRAMDYFKIDLDERIEFYERVRFVSAIVLAEQHKDQQQKLEAARRKK